MATCKANNMSTYKNAFQILFYESDSSDDETEIAIKHKEKKHNKYNFYEEQQRGKYFKWGCTYDEDEIIVWKGGNNSKNKTNQ